MVQTRFPVPAFRFLRRFAPACIALVAIGSAGCARPPQSADGAASAMAGLPGVEVRVFQIRNEMVRYLVPEESLQVDFERRLHREGIPVLTSEACAQTPGEPQLYVLYKAVRVGAGRGYAFGTDLYLVQTVQLSRDPSRTARAITWNSTSGIGTTVEPSVEEARSWWERSGAA